MGAESMGITQLEVANARAEELAKRYPRKWVAVVATTEEEQCVIADAASLAEILEKTREPTTAKPLVIMYIPSPDEPLQL